MPDTDVVAALTEAGFVVEPGQPVDGVDEPIVNVVLGVKDWSTVGSAQAIAKPFGVVCNFFVWPQPTST